MTASNALFFALVALILVGWFFLAKRLMSTPARHWRFFNILCRLGGLWFTTGGAVFIAWGVYYQLHPEDSVSINMVSGSAAVDFYVVGVLVAGIGLLLLRARAFRPDLGDAALPDRAMRALWGLPRNWARPKVPGRDSRTWWTGETKPPGGG